MTRARHLLILPVLLLSIAAHSPAHADNVLRPHLLKPEAYSETYTAVFAGDDGTHLKIQFAVTNIGIGDQFSMCRILYADGDTIWNDESIFPKGKWAYSNPDLLEIGPCFIKADEKRTEIVADVDKGRITARIESPLKPVKPPGCRIESGNDFFDLQTLIPWSQARLQIELKDTPAQSVQAVVSMYHFWVTAWPDEIARLWIRVYGLNPEQGPFLIMSHFPPGNDPAVGSIWLPGETQPILFDKLELLEDQDKQKVMHIIAQGKSYSIKLQNELYRHAPIEELGILGKIVGLFIGNWATRTYRAELIFPGDTGSIPVIVEITADE